MSRELEGKVAIVTGGGRGIGRGIVESLLKAGAKVAVLQRGALEGALDDRDDVLGVRLDLSDIAAYRSAVDDVVAAFGRIDILVNNAGMMIEREISEITPEDWHRMMAVNTAAPLFLTQAVLPHLASGGGSVINIGSIEGEGANPLHASYSASKAAVHGMTRAMAVDLGAKGIRVNAIAPGWIVSDLSETYLRERPDADAAEAALRRMHPVGRLGQPGDIGDVAVFLASESARFVTGQVITVDGGRTAKLPTP